MCCLSLWNVICFNPVNVEKLLSETAFFIKYISVKWITTEKRERFSVHRFLIDEMISENSSCFSQQKRINEWQNFKICIFIEIWIIFQTVHVFRNVFFPSFKVSPYFLPCFLINATNIFTIVKRWAFAIRNVWICVLAYFDF